MPRQPAFATILDHEFTRPILLDEALTHPSVAPRKGRRGGGYERLEFLGDRVLGLVVAEMLFAAFPHENEGALARRHAALVRREALTRVAEAIGLGPYLALSKGEDDGGGRDNPAILADACEAVIGALYADGGLEPAARFIRRHWQPLMGEAVTPPKDPKTALQEWAQGLGKPLPVYDTVAVDGPAHDPIFVVTVRVEGVEPVSASGSSKRVAERNAAAAMLENMQK